MSKSRAAAALLAVCVLVPGCSEDQRPTSPSSGLPPGFQAQVLGRLRDFQSNAGMAGVVLEWYIQDPGMVRFVDRTTTDPMGSYSILLASAGMYVVSIGERTFAAKIYVPGGVYRTDLATGHSDCPIMFGSTFDASTSGPLAGATVSWVDTQAISQADGTYMLDLGCRPGGYGSGTSAIAVTHPAYVGIGQTGPRRETLRLGGFSRLDFALTPR